MAAVMNYHRDNSLMQDKVQSHSSRGQKSEMCVRWCQLSSPFRGILLQAFSCIYNYIPCVAWRWILPPSSIIFLLILLLSHDRLPLRVKALCIPLLRTPEIELMAHYNNPRSLRILNLKCAFSRCQTNGTMPCVAFCFWLLLFPRTFLRLIYKWKCSKLSIKFKH